VIDPVVHMAAMGAVTSVMAPATILATRHRTSWRPLRLPPAGAAVGFVILHAAVVLSDYDAFDVRGVVLHGALFAGAIAFWLPVLGEPPALEPGMRAGYLFLTAPALDLPAVILIARGDNSGLAMIVAMLPIGIAAVALAWRWMAAEERAAVHADDPLPRM
jgi:hypothetical protein